MNTIASVNSPSHQALSLNGYQHEAAFRSAMAATLAARELLLSYYQQALQIDEKDKAGLVTQADRESESLMKARLSKDFPTYDFLGEETHYLEGSPKFLAADSGVPRWILDPLDGTTNFVHGFAVFCISLALEVNGKIEIGIIDCPALRETFCAVRGRGAFRNGKPIRVSQRIDVKQSLLATGFFADNVPSLNEQLKIFGQLVKCSRGVRRAGAAAYDLCMVASGVFDLFWEKNLKPWDVAAGALLVEEAGGKVSSYRGREFSLLHNSIIAGNPAVHHEVLDVIQPLLEVSTD